MLTPDEFKGVLEDLRGLSHFFYLYHVDSSLSDDVCVLIEYAETRGFKTVISIDLKCSSSYKKLMKSGTSEIIVMIPSSMALAEVQERLSTYVDCFSCTGTAYTYTKFCIPRDYPYCDGLLKLLNGIKLKKLNWVVQTESLRIRTLPIVVGDVLCVRQPDYDYFSEVSMSVPLLDLFKLYPKLKIKLECVGN